MESKAILKYARITPSKMRRVSTLVKGKKAEEAMFLLAFMPYRGAAILKKLLKSAMSNAEQKEVSEPEQMVISKVYVDKGPMRRKIRPRAMGRANILKKKTSHITIILSEKRE